LSADGCDVAIDFSGFGQYGLPTNYGNIAVYFS
jgi:hypothetical protein